MDSSWFPSSPEHHSKGIRLPVLRALHGAMRLRAFRAKGRLWSTPDLLSLEAPCKAGAWMFGWILTPFSGWPPSFKRIADMRSWLWYVSFFVYVQDVYIYTHIYTHTFAWACTTYVPLRHVSSEQSCGECSEFSSLLAGAAIAGRGAGLLGAGGEDFAARYFAISVSV